MKKLLLITAIAFSLFSCSKPEDIINRGSDPVSENGSIEYKVNGSLIVMDNINLLNGQYAIFKKQLKGSVRPATMYSLNAQNGPNNATLFAIETDSLLQKNYHYDSASVSNNSTFAFFFTSTNSELAYLYYSGDYFDINITSYQNSRISGTFKAKYTPFTSTGTKGAPGSVLITEGKINNVQVIY